MRLLLLCFFGVFASGCFTLVGPPHSGFETDELSCADERDNDQDGRIDCMDDGCIMRGFCGEYIPLTPFRDAENVFDRCIDGIDNDGDGQFDCGDRDCQPILELCCFAETEDASCSDRIDNDGNGFADCAEFSCSRNPYVRVCASELDCTDGYDSDGDRFFDCGDPDCAEDPACLPPPETNCTNGIDDNGDERGDCFDPGCYADPSCLGPENTVERCSDGNDNDGNGFADCGDFDCSMHPDPAVRELCVPENTLALCSNGVDDDGNAFVDCDDFGCTQAARGATPEAIEYCATQGENTLERCSDGIDNDGDNFIDCLDFACTQASQGASPEAIQYCAERTETTFAQCTDGIDNDGSGFIDCLDFSCSRSDDPALVEHCILTGEATYANCTDGRDNDRNGHVDCEDFSCAVVQGVQGSDACDVAAECRAGFDCVERVCRRACTPGEPGACPMGSQCHPELLECVESCFDHSDCEAGESCFRTLCLDIRSPCFEALPLGLADQSQGDVPDNITTEEQIAMAVALCTDGVDNDQDGFTDCQDWECNHSPFAVDASGNSICRYAGGRTCVLGPRVGIFCASDADCGALSGACGPPGPEGQPFVCP